jgi:hypothetical protein
MIAAGRRSLAIMEARAMRAMRPPSPPLSTASWQAHIDDEAMDCATVDFLDVTFVISEPLVIPLERI